tara:strand:- start:9398 stop:10765 length:1368 start_codon:yes stop_codon:yes gene_type:complete
MSESSDIGKGKKETVYFFGWNVVSKIVTYVVLLVLANIFAVEAYGKASYAFSIFNLVLLFLLIGLPHTFVSWHIKKKDSGSVVYFLSLASLLFVILGLIIFWGTLWIIPLVVALPFFLIKSIGESFFRINHKHHMVQAVGVLGMVFYLIFLFLFRKSGEVGIISAFAVSYIFVSLVVLVMNYGNFSEVYRKFAIDIGSVREYFRKGVVTALIAASFAFLGWIDSFILGILSTYKNVADYNIAGAISGIIVTIPLSLSMFLLTRSAEVGGIKKSKAILYRILRISFSFSLLSAIVLVSFMPILLKIFFPKYVGVGPFVMVLLLSLLFYAIHYTISTYYSGRLEPEMVLVPIVFAALLNIILDVVLIPQYGVFGITVATLIAHFSAMFLLLVKSKMVDYLLPVVLMSSFVWAAYVLGIFGLLLLVPVIPLLFFSEMLTREDWEIFVDVLKNSVSKKN